MMTSRILISFGFTKTQKQRYLENETFCFLQIKKFINYTSRATLWQKSFVAEVTFNVRYHDWDQVQCLWTGMALNEFFFFFECLYFSENDIRTLLFVFDWEIGHSLSTYATVQVRIGIGKLKNRSQDTYVLNGSLETNVVEYFLCIGSVKYTRASPPARKMSLFSSIIITIVLSYAIIRI